MKKTPLKMMKTTSAEDRISGLPESVLHHVLSFLDMKEVVQTSFISKRWRCLWTSVPDLNFDYSLWKKNQDIRPYVKRDFGKDKCVQFVDRVLLFRDNGYSIRKIHLSHHYCSDPGRIHTWLILAAKRHFKVVHLEITCPEKCLLPNLLFSSEIEVFKLCSLSFSQPIQLPDSMCSARKLRILELVAARLPSGDSNGELILSCPLLESLILKDCDHHYLKLLYISAIQLKNLVLTTVSAGMCEIKIYTPNLTSFHLEYGSYADYSLENLSSLVSAKIGSPYWLRTKHFIKVVNGLSNTETLELFDWTETLAGSHVMCDQLLVPFMSLRSLKLIRLPNVSCIRVVAELLKNSPYIENVVIEVIEARSSKTKKEKDWGVELSFQHMFYHLKCFKVQNLKGFENEVKFIEFILKNAVVLENFIVTFSRTVSEDTKELQEFGKKLLSLPKASERVTTHFL